jgi:SpoU rRNA Methylase family
MSSSVSNKPAIVLVSPKGPDNIGSTARAMKNFGLSDLRIVQPRCRLEQARMMASHAQDVLEVNVNWWWQPRLEIGAIIRHRFRLGRSRCCL